MSFTMHVRHTHRNYCCRDIISLQQIDGHGGLLLHKHLINYDYIYLHCVSINVPTYFCTVSVNYKPISKKNGRHVLEETVNKTVYEVLTSHQISGSTTLGNLKRQTEQ